MHVNRLLGAIIDVLGSAIGVEQLFVNQHWAASLAVPPSRFNYKDK